MSWLEQHLEEFVKPQLKSYGDEYWAQCEFSPLGYFEQEELTVMKNAWRSIKRRANGQTILLPGRDVWLFEVLARRENYPTVFMPECSRMTVRHIAKTQPELAELFLFDTGFAGSIPRNIGSHKHSLLSANKENNNSQIFPRLSLSRHFALKIEDTPKYWESGRMVGNSYTYGNNWNVNVSFDPVSGTPGEVTYSSNTTNTTVPQDEILQPLALVQEFAQAARLTIEVYTNSSPKFINRHKPIKTEGRKLW